MEMNKLKRPSFLSQFFVLIIRSLDVLSNDLKQLFMIIILPVLCSVLIAMIGKDLTFKNFEDTQVNLFSIVCATIFIGMFNSLQDICKERNILKREYMTNLRLDSYIFSKLSIQAIICFFQTLILTIVFFTYFNFPREGLVFYSSTIDGFITIFLMMLSASMLGLFISSIVKSPEMANLVAPVVIILQIVFSGALTKLEGVSQKISAIMISRWGIDGLSAIGRLGEQKYKIQQMFPNFPLEIVKELEFESSRGYLCKVWFIFLIIIIFFTILSGIAVTNISKDSR